MATARKAAPARKNPVARAAARALKPAPAPTPARTKPSAKAAAVVQPGKKAEKPKKPKMVRDSFTIPKAEYGALDELKARAAKLGRPAKKSEVLRAGVKALAAMTDEALLACLAQVPAIKTGRPAKSGK
jgi:hypothetical protein